jgi:hypothetical protein
MFTLHVDLTVKPEAQQDLEAVYREPFFPRFRCKPGFTLLVCCAPTTMRVLIE